MRVLISSAADGRVHSLELRKVDRRVGSVARAYAKAVKSDSEMELARSGCGSVVDLEARVAEALVDGELLIGRATSTERRVAPLEPASSPDDYDEVHVVSFPDVDAGRRARWCEVAGPSGEATVSWVCSRRDVEREAANAVPAAQSSGESASLTVAAHPFEAGQHVARVLDDDGSVVASRACVVAPRRATPTAWTHLDPRRRTAIVDWLRAHRGGRTLGASLDSPLSQRGISRKTRSPFERP